jgi:putative transposase
LGKLKISTPLDRQFCIDAVVEAIENYGIPEYFNTDQGTQYTSDDFTGGLESHNIKISMNSKGRALDNIFVERLWRTVKYDYVYIKDYTNVSECKTGLQEYFKTYNERRLHQELDYKTSMDVHKKELEKLIAA